GDRGVEPGRYVGEETIGKPKRKETDGEDRYRDLQLNSSDSQRIEYISKQPRARARMSIDVRVRCGVVGKRFVGKPRAVGDAIFVHVAGMPERGKRFVIVEGVREEIGIDEDAAQDGTIADKNGEPCSVDLRKLPQRASVPAMRARCRNTPITPERPCLQHRWPRHPRSL